MAIACSSSDGRSPKKLKRRGGGTVRRGEDSASTKFLGQGRGAWCFSALRLSTSERDSTISHNVLENRFENESC